MASRFVSLNLRPSIVIDPCEVRIKRRSASADGRQKVSFRFYVAHTEKRLTKRRFSAA